MIASGLDYEILINAVHVRPALWEQGDKNYQNIHETETVGRNGCRMQLFL
jgi:hypothetical protein